MPTKRGSRAVTVEQSESKHGLLEGALYVPLKTHTEVLELPLLPIRNTVLMPNVVTPLFVGRDQSMKAIDDAMGKGRTLVVVTQLNEEIEDPGPDDMYAVGVEGSIDRLLKMPDGSTSILIRGQRRLRLLEYTQQTPFMRVRVEAVHEEAERTLALEALVRAVLALFEKCVKLSRTLPEEAYITAMNIDEPLLSNHLLLYARTSWKHLMSKSDCKRSVFFFPKNSIFWSWKTLFIARYNKRLIRHSASTFYANNSKLSNENWARPILLYRNTKNCVRRYSPAACPKRSKCGRTKN